MKKQKNLIWRNFLITRIGQFYSKYTWIKTGWSGVLRWKRGISLLLLALFVFNVGAPTGLAWYEIRLAQAADLGGVVSNAVASVFGKAGEIFQQYDSKSAALDHKNSTLSQSSFDLVAIMVDESIANNTEDFDGLRSTYNPSVPAAPDKAYLKLEAKTLMERVERYAEDVQGINKVKNPQPYLKTVVIKVKKTDSTIDIATALEKLYREGDGTIQENNKLKGIVLIGDIPLPVVNKNGHRFVSLFPYTDFEDPYYVIDPETEDFVLNTANKNAAAEVWHGVIKAPVNGPEGNNLLAEYFDKNHLYKLGVPAYADFAKKLFYSDLLKEFQSIGVEGLPGYQNYLKYWEDISYFRFNKTWAQKLFSESSFGKPEGDGFDNDNDGKIDEDPSNGYDDDGDAEKGSPLFGLINRVDDDGDGKIDNDEEGVWGYCSVIPATGKKVLENCKMPGMPYKTDDFYNVKPGSKYFVSDGVNNDAENNIYVDEGIDEDEGDAFIKVDNDRDGRVDEDTSRDNDADLDKRIDEDGPGDMNSDGCPGQCNVDEDQDSVDSDTDLYPDGYEKEYGSLSLNLSGLKDLIGAASSGNVKAVFDSLKVTTDREEFFDFPLITFSPPVGPSFLFPRILPFPSEAEWIDEGSPSDDDEDGKIDEDGTVDNDNDKDGSADEDPGDALGNDGKGSGDFMDQLPDIRTKDVIMNFMKNYDQLVERFYADINVWTDFTGRYSHTYTGTDGSKQSDLVVMPALIAAKDEFTRIYLKHINDALEKRVDQYVQKLQYDINLAKGASLSGYVVLADTNGVFAPNQKIKFNQVDFINFGYKNDSFFGGVEALMESLKTLAPGAIEPAKEAFLDSLAGPVNALTPIYINGRSIDSITNIEQCSLYRGSEGGENSQMVIANTVFDQAANFNADPPPQMPESWKTQSNDALIGVEGNDYHGLYWWWNNHPDSPMVQWLAKQRTLNKAFAGCFSENSSFPDRCFPTLASRYIFSLGGTRKVSGVPSSAVSHQACFDMKEKTGYDAYALAANIYLKTIGEKQVQVEKKAQDAIKPLPGSAYKSPKNIKLIDFANKPPEDYEILPDTYLPIPPALIVAAQASPILGNFNVNLEDVLKKYLGADRIDNNGNGLIDEAAESNTAFFAINPSDGQPNWNQIGEQLLQRSRFDEASAEAKNKPLKFGNEVIPGTKEVYIRVNAIPGKTISSLTYHKEPTVDTLQAQTYELKRDANGIFIEDAGLTDKEKKNSGKYEVVTKTAPDGTSVKKETRYASSIPIDSPRYVSFRDSKGNYQKIVYPNAFKANSITEFKQQLNELENQLKSIEINPLYAGVGPASIDGHLTGVLDGGLINDVINTSEDMISVVAEKKMADALEWKAMDLDQKHQYVFSRYLGNGFSPFTSLTESAKGYEMLYLVSGGDKDSLSMSFNKDIPGPKAVTKTEKLDCSIAANKNKAACKTDGSLPDVPVPADSDSGAGNEANMADMEPVMIFEWFVRLGEWAKETEEIINGKGSVASCPVGSVEDYIDLDSQNADLSGKDNLIPLPVNLEGVSQDEIAKQTVKLNLKLENQEKNVLRAKSNDQTKLIVEAIKSDGKINTLDSVNQVKLVFEEINNGEKAKIKLIGKDTAQMVGGRAEFTVKAGEIAGTVTLESLLNGDEKKRSNAVNLTVSEKQIKLISYRRYKTYKFIEGPAAGYQIYDGNGNLVADVNSKTGYIKIANNDYEIKVLPAVADKPVRITLVDKNDGKLIALLYFILDGQKKITIDSPGINYFEKYQELKGVHLKDLSANDQYSLKTNTGQGELKDFVTIVKGEEDIGLIDQLGGIYLNENLKIAQKAAPSGDGAVVLEIQDLNGQALIEAYLGAEFEFVTNIEWEKVKDLLAWGGEKIFGPEVWKWAGIKTAHAQDKTGFGEIDTDQDGLRDLEEIIIGTKSDQADSNGDGIKDLDSINQGLNPLIKEKQLFNDLKPGQEGFAEIVKLFRRGLIVTDQDGKVRPKDPITREEFIKLDLGGICIICDRFTEKTKNSVWSLYSKAPFPDQDISEQYKYCVAEGKNRGIISGYKAFENAGFYVPKASISRAEATKVILETARQQIESFPDFVNEEPVNKPWYYNYILTAQKEGLYPKGKFLELDKYDSEEFKNYLNNEIANTLVLPGGIANSQFLIWLNQPVSRVEFAIMVSRFTDKYDCLAIDSDGDGIPDNLEKYIYGTNPLSTDSDQGGISDNQEIQRGSDPNKTDDDFPVALEDLSADPDQDGLNTGKEKEIGTDPNDADTDKGGVKDGVEVIRATDPLDQGDDNKNIGDFNPDNGITGIEGAYLAGLEIKNATIYSLPDNLSVGQEQINTEETDRLPADGESQIYVKASIYDENGKIQADDNESIVNFGFLDNNDYQYASLSPLKVKAQNGIAETVLTAKTRSGLPTVIASIDGINIPSDQRLIEVHALDPAKVELQIDSPIIPSGGLSSTNIKAILRDKFGNLANAGSYTGDFRLINIANQQELGASIDQKIDEDNQKAGIQITSVTGEFQARLISGISPENFQVEFSYQPETTVSGTNANDSTADLLDLGEKIFKPNAVAGTLEVTTRDDLKIFFTTDKTELKADNKDKTKIIIRLTDGQGNTLDDYEGEITLKIVSEKLADLIDGEKKGKTLNKKLIDGQAEFELASTFKAGEIVLMANTNGVKPALITLESYADNAKEILLESDNLEISANPLESHIVKAKLYDLSGNLVERDNASLIEFSIDPESAKFASIIGDKVKKVVAGEADITIKTGTLTGPVRIRARSAGMNDGYLEIVAKTRFAGKNFREIKPKVLFASILGSNFGQVTEENYLAGWLVFSGKVQSAVSLVADPKPKLNLAQITAEGRVNIDENAELEIAIKTTADENLPIRQLVTDQASGQDVMEVVTVLKPQTIVKKIGNIDEVQKGSDIVYIWQIDQESTLYEINTEIDRAVILKDGDLIAEIDNQAKVRVYNPLIQVIPTEDIESNLIDLTITDLGNEIARMVIAPGELGDVKIVDGQFKFSDALTTGVYLRKLANLANRKFESAFSGNSSKKPKGANYLDLSQDLSGSQAPGLGYDSLEKGGEVDGIGFKGDNKHMLLMAAGNSTGEANLSYASDAGIVLGDPTVRLNNQRDPLSGDKLFGSTGFTKDIGKMIYAGVTNIKEITTVDFDNDSDRDVLIAYQDGKIRLLENVNKGKGFNDRGNLLDLANGLISLAVGDLNNDGWQDLVIASMDSCKVGEVCVEAFLNDKGNFVRKNLDLEGFTSKNKVYAIKIADLNQDSYPDIITSDDRGEIKAFYTREGQLNKQPSLIGGLGTQINQSDNLKAEVYVNYTGMTGNQPGPADDKYFQKILLKGEDASKDKNLEFKSLSKDVVIGLTSTKKVSDQTEPKNVLAEQDTLLYTLTINNTTNVAINNLLIADVISSIVEVDQESIKCLDCQKEITISETGISLRPYILSGIDLPAKSSRTITYSGKVGKLPKVRISVGQNLSSIYPVKDGYPDIMATPEDNPTGKIIYYYSISKDNSSGAINYAEMVSSGSDSSSTGYKQPVNPENGKPVGIDLKLFEEKGPDGLPVAVKHFMDYGTFPGMEGSAADSNEDNGLPGVGEAMSGFGDSLDKAADDLAAGIAALTCTSGCIPLPINYAFLAPGPINVMGIPSGFDPGLPVFAAGIPSIIPVWPPSPYQASVFRLYVMPTLTGKVATSMCMGTYLVGFGPVPGNCFTVVLPVDIYEGLCSMIGGAIEGALGTAEEFSNDGEGTIGVADDGDLANTPTADGSNYTGGFSAASSLGNYGVKASVSTNVRMPGFPSVLTDWLDNQSSEIINKLTDLPDIYILLPDLLSPFRTGDKNAAGQGVDNLTNGDKNVKKEPVSPKGLRGVLNEINKIPMISIVPQEVLIKIPSLTPAEIDRFINDAKQWVQDEKAELQRVLSLWKCGPFKEMVPDPNGGVGPDGKQKMVPGYIDTDGSVVYGDRPYAKLCDILTVDMTDLIQSVEKNIEIIEGYKQLPRQILAWRNMLTKYVVQVICYVDAILNFFVGNIGKWINQANAWVDAVAKLIEAVATWKLMFDLIIDYQTSCDKCTSARFTLLELVLKLFAFIPSPPVIPFPKLPDIYLDFSQVQLGVKILFPDVKFRPERIILPKLPRIVLPDLPTANIELPAIPLLPDLKLALPELPDLPPLTLPQLPNLPPPPKIPELPGGIKATISILKKIFLILCLIKKGFIPTQEASLKTTVEHMTERGLDPLLPFDLGLAFQQPEISYEYVDRVVLSVKINLNNAIDLNFIYDFVQEAADNLNSLSTTFVKGLNDLSKSAELIMADQAESINQGLDNSVPDGTGSDKALLNYLPDAGEISDEELIKELGYFSPYLAETISGLRTASLELEKEAARYQEMIDQDYQDVELIATTITLSKDDPSLNRSIEDLENVNINASLMALGNDFGETRKLAGLRQNLLAYAKENDQINQKLINGDLYSAGIMLAEAPSMGEILDRSGYEGGTMFAEKSSLYAQIPSINDIVANSGLPSSLQNKQALKGMYIYNESKKQNEKLIEYNEEVALPTTMNFVDTNNDGDKDLIYSYGGNVYLKENYNNTGSIGQFYGGQPKFVELQELVPASPGISGFETQFDGNKTVDLKWNKALDKDLAGYEIIIGKRLNNLIVPAAIDNLKSADLKKIVFLNSLQEAGEFLTDSMLQPENAYNFPVSKIHQLVADQVNGQVVYDGPVQKSMVPGVKEKLIGGMEVFAQEDSVLRINLAGQEKANKPMSKHELFTMPENFSGDLEIILESGAVSLIDTKNIQTNQKLSNGSKIDLDRVYRSIQEGSAIIKLTGDTYTRVDAGQSLEIRILESSESPQASLSLENGSYYSVVRSFDKTGFRSTKSDTALLSPNICADRQDPLPVAGPAERTVAIFKTLEIDASKSFDPFGEVESFYMDTNLDFDSDQDGDKTNDKNLGRDLNLNFDSDGDGVSNNDLDDAKFYLGPYKDLMDRKVMLNLLDQSGNLGQQEITIKVYVPEIYLNESSANLEIIESGDGIKVSGYINQPEADIPVSIIRERAGVKELIKTKTGGINGKYLTDQNGEFEINDLQLKDTIIIKNSAGEVIAEIDPKTGRIVLKNPLYQVEALPAEEPLLPTRVVVKTPLGEIIATLFIVSDANTDVVIDPADMPYNAGTVALFEGVHIKNMTAAAGDLSMKSIPADQAKYAGGVEILENSTLKRVALLDAGGNFYIYDTRLKLALKAASDLKEPMIFTVNWTKADQNKVEIANFHIAFSNDKPIQIVDADKFKIFTGNGQNKGPKFDSDKDGMPDLWEDQFGLDKENPADAQLDKDLDKLTNLDEYLAGTNPLLADSDNDGYQDGFEKTFGRDPNKKAESPFVDVDTNNPYYQSILNFWQRGILSSIPAGNSLKFGFEQPINRAEYAKVMLDTFCIVPRPEATQAPGVFTDIPYQEGRLPWYFAATKEAYFQGFITGYRGLIDKETGRTPFAPEATITKAEAVKIILEALEREGLIELGQIPLTEPYYLPYMNLAKDLDAVKKAGVELKANFILTDEESLDPEKALVRGEFIKLADRVLTAYDCSLIDTDGDQIPDFWEKQHGLDYLDPNDADEDPDRDRLRNLNEYKYGTEPLIADSDKGGIGDGEEVLDRQTNPLKPEDDFKDSDADGLSDQDEINKYGTKPGEKDSDGGGVSDGDEILKNSTNPLNSLDDLDSDGDGLGDQEEQTIYKTDYLDPDTDDGGIEDGVEVKRNTNPLEEKDDLIDPRQDLESGIYVIQEACSVCPCKSAIDHSADLIPGDLILGIIANDNSSEIFSQSNLVEIESIKTKDT